jgi:hypothetical protein
LSAGGLAMLVQFKAILFAFALLFVNAAIDAELQSTKFERQDRDYRPLQVNLLGQLTTI